MKKLYKNKKLSSKVNPSISSNIDDYLAMLIPSAILTLVASLSDEDKQVLAYLISCSNNPTNFHTKSINNNKGRAKEDGNNFSGKKGHSPAFECDCFGCYMSFWARWDASENRQLIHEIIEAYEDDDSAEEKRVKSGKIKKSKRSSRNTNNNNNNNSTRVCEEVLVKEEKVVVVEDLVGLKQDGYGVDDQEEGGEVGIEKGNFRRLLSFLGDKVSGFWNMG